MDTRAQLERILAERIALLDGSWGVLIQRQVRGEEAYRGERFANHPRDVAGNPDLLNLTKPDVVLGIHHAYLEAGADITTTNTFTATTIGQADYGLEPVAYEMNLEGARLARRACPRRRVQARLPEGLRRRPAGHGRAPRRRRRRPARRRGARRAARTSIGRDPGPQADPKVH